MRRHVDQALSGTLGYVEGLRSFSDDRDFNNEDVISRQRIEGVYAAVWDVNSSELYNNDKKNTRLPFDVFNPLCEATRRQGDSHAELVRCKFSPHLKK
ncbi:hypothetical protein FOPE_07748 [Fonsecaea pedrosoi]|nr:hypothetical protein FOPE_07748 [Fonsecaea pedrosoi]